MKWRVKSSMTLLRGYCLFQEMRPYLKIFSFSNKNVQEVIRNIDKKSKYRFPFIEAPLLEKEKKDNTEKIKENQASQAV